ncbi:MAG: malto-oligosyltrehalose trehalohydrolase [Vicinamibacterales bacterium]
MPEGAPAWRPRFGAIPGPDGVTVRVWAPAARTVDVVGEDGRRTPLTPEADGTFAGPVATLAVGTRYRVSVDGGDPVPDPASRCQPDGVHGPSQVVDATTFAWTTCDWVGRALSDLVIYELHVGTFTPEGTFAAAAARLPWLAELGVTAIELMPVAASPGARNWGYDGAALFAPSPDYGQPDDLRRFVDEAHAQGLAVIVDVVYNHFGPDGAYAAALSAQFFSERHRSPWGAGINLDGPGSAAVRAFFIENALHWVMEYCVDGLRLDATHAMVDDGPEHFLAELTRRVRETAGERRVLVIAEDHRNLRTIVDTTAAGGWGLDAVWADDFHHVARRLTAGDTEGYYEDFAGTTDELAETVARGWLYTGGLAPHFGGPRGTDPAGLPLAAFVVCIQNHDQVGNRALGERLNHQVDPAVYRALSLFFLLVPETPLLFMGQEWAAGTPFQYFTDHGEPLGSQVREGRRNEFRHFRAFADPARRDAIPDPQSPATFERSRLDWKEVERDPHAGVLALYRDGLWLRHLLQAEGPSGTFGTERVRPIGAEAVVMRRRRRTGGDLLVVTRFATAGAVAVPIAGGGPWRVRASSEAPHVVRDPMPPRLADAEGRLVVGFERPGTVVLEPVEGAADVEMPGEPA